MAQNSEDNLEEREQRLREMEVRAALDFQRQQDEIVKRAEALDARERAFRDRENQLDDQVDGQENSLRMLEEQIKRQEKAVRDNEKKFAQDKAEFEAQKQDLAVSPSTPTIDSGRSHEGQESIRFLEEALVVQENEFKARLDSSLSNQRAEFDVQLHEALAAQESKFTTQLREVEKVVGAASQEVAKLRQELIDKSDEYDELSRREAALQAQILRMQEQEVVLAKEKVETSLSVDLVGSEGQVSESLKTSVASVASVAQDADISQQPIVEQIRVKQTDKESEIPKASVEQVFGEASDLWKYLKSAKSKDLAASLDRNMKHHNITIPQNLTIDDSMKKNFSPEVLAKMEEVGRELEKRIAQRSTFSGKFRQKVGDYSAIVAHAFKKLFGKKVDDPNLKKACDEYNKNSPHLEGEKAKNVGKFVAQALHSKGGKIENLPNNLRH